MEMNYSQKEKCSRCKKYFGKPFLIEWLEGLDTLTPKFCKNCYIKIRNSWEAGIDIESEQED